jgi:hypothetical protein
MILEAVPRFLIRSCCMDLQHCADIRGADPASVDACKKVMEDLASLNERIGDILQTEEVKMVRTGDLLTGRVDSPIALYMDSLYDLWGSDTVHGDKLAYSKIAIGLLVSTGRCRTRTSATTSSPGSAPSTPPRTCCVIVYS